MSQNEDKGQGPKPKAQVFRPGAMTMAMQTVNTKPLGQKVLRIGVIQGVASGEVGYHFERNQRVPGAHRWCSGRRRAPHGRVQRA